MTFNLKIEVDLEAFAEDEPAEFARMLSELSIKAESGDRKGFVWNFDGHEIGTWEVKE